MGRKALGLALAAAAALLPVAGAQANTVVIGSQFQGPIAGALFDGGTGTAVNTSLTSPLNVASPTDGTVISWRMSAATQAFTPQIVRPLGGNQYTEAGSGAPQVGTGLGNILGPFPLNLAVKQGDLFGVIGQENSRLGAINRPGGSYGYFVPPLQPGQSRPPDFGGPASVEYAIAATVRYCLVPNLKGKKPKQARQALKAADCTIGTKKKSKKRRKKKKVVGQSAPAGASISDTAPVNFKVSRPAR